MTLKTRAGLTKMRSKFDAMAGDYTYMYRWSLEDDCYLAKALEWEGLIAHGDCKTEAYENIRSAVAEAIELLIEEGREDEIPEPRWHTYEY